MILAGFAAGSQRPELLLEQALEQALGGAPACVSGALALFSPAQLPLPGAALQRLAQRLQCPQIRAGSFPGVLVGDHVVFGQPACALWLLTPPLGLGEQGALPLLWAKPQYLEEGELPGHERAQFGLISGKQSWFWRYPQSRQLLHTAFLGPITHRQLVSTGISPLTEFFPHYRQEGALLLQLERYSALPLLARNIPFALREAKRLPLDRLLLGERDAQSRIRYVQILATDTNRSGLWLERPLTANTQVFLAWRNPEAALRDTRAAVELLDKAQGTPDFAWISSSSGRASDFFPSAENDLRLWRSRFPHCPILGSFSQAEVLYGPEGGRITRFSTVFDAFYRLPQAAD
ncbi:MAG: hypothetical protein U7M05_05365 [Candidatus Igneacidithiobacillus chanchocoensis]